MALGSTQPLTEMSITSVKGGRCVRMTTYHHLCHEIWAPYFPGTLWAPLGPSGPLRACNGTALPFHHILMLFSYKDLHMHACH